MELKRYLQIIGPGLLYAGAAVGVSHLVQSTRAGAIYGFDLIWVLLIANFLKYPFFEFGPRYAISTGKNLIEGYKGLGKWAIIIFAIQTIIPMFAIVAAVTLVTAGLISNVFELSISNVTLSSIILIITTLILFIGKYKILDKIIKLIIALLAVSTIVAVISALGLEQNFDVANKKSFDWLNRIDIFFLIAFIGWMPAPIDLAVWQSIWSIEKYKGLSFKPNLRQGLIDFKIGYIGTIFIAIGFVLLGALIMHGSGESLSPKGAVFAGQLIKMYTTSIGGWAYTIIAIAAITTMFSTIITVLDAYPRVLGLTTEILFPKLKEKFNSYKYISLFWIGLMVTGSLLLMSILSSSMGFMVDLATTISFVLAPIMAFMNLKVIRSKDVPEKNKPKLALLIWAWVGIVFLSVFTLVFLYWRFFV